MAFITIGVELITSVMMALAGITAFITIGVELITSAMMALAGITAFIIIGVIPITLGVTVPYKSRILLLDIRTTTLIQIVE